MSGSQDPELCLSLRELSAPPAGKRDATLLFSPDGGSAAFSAYFLIPRQFFAALQSKQRRESSALTIHSGGPTQSGGALVARLQSDPDQQLGIE